MTQLQKSAGTLSTTIVDEEGEVFAPVEMQSVVEVVTKQILGLISSGALKAGDRLPSEVDLARRLRVGRSTVREVKQILGSWGFLRFEGTRGCFITEPQLSSGNADTNALLVAVRHGSLEDLHEARTILDTGVIRLVTLRITPAQVNEVEQLLDQLEQTINEPGVFFKAAAQFHVLLTSFCGNPILEKFHKLIAEMALEDQLPEYQRESEPSEVLEIHRRLLRAVASGDVDVAEREMIAHLDESHHKTELASQRPANRASLVRS